MQGFCLLVLTLLPVEKCQIVQTHCCIRMLSSQMLIFDCQCSLIQRFCLLKLTLFAVKKCQVAQAACCIRMLSSQMLLTDGECSLMERFCISILSSFSQVVVCLLEEMCGFCYGEREALYPRCAGQHLWEKLFTSTPLLKVTLWESCVHRPHDTLHPLPQRLTLHSIPPYCLH